MKIREIKIVSEFKRFKELTISDLPESAKLVVLIGPNGCGKSSLFDAMNAKSRSYRQFFDSASYYLRSQVLDINSLNTLMRNRINISFFGENVAQEDYSSSKKTVYIRSAHRNDPSLDSKSISNPGSALDENQMSRMIDDSKTAKLNYQRLAWKVMKGVLRKTSNGETVAEFQEKMLGEIRDPVMGLFPELELTNLSSKSDQSTFCFDKGEVKDFTYENLSGGEKAAFDLILDIVVKREEYDDTIFCIDEPEAHVSMRLQGKLLRILYDLVPSNCQLWIATHSIGMMREAYNLQKQNHDDVVFLDFDGRDFDKPQEIKPAKMNRALWESMHEVVLGDLANLVMPNTIYLCESTPEKSFDANCYNKIFSEDYPDVKFLSVGSKSDVERICSLLKTALPDLRIISLRDRDDMTDAKIREVRSAGERILERRCIEAYLLDDEVFEAFFREFGIQEYEELLTEVKKIRDEASTFKDAAGRIRAYFVSNSQLPENIRIGDNREEFLEYSLVPLIKPGMQTYQELKRDIFDNNSDKQ